MLEKIADLLDRLSALPHWQLAFIAVLAVGVLAGGFFLLRPAPRPRGELHVAGEEAAAEPRVLTVHVAGAVARPGVVRLQEGARVLDAVEGAGGPLPEADLDALNLAQPVQDGQKISVPRKGENGGSTQGEGGKSSGKVNINTADADELEKLPGIGPTLAERIVSYRENNGGFRSVEDLKKVSGIGEKKFAELRDLVEI
ncbi:MAG: helix-hairpin-helix domain-containing protein [Actinobacteria bacterium]|nr:helix-hairpin-helix domain-containing protein [Actinomycetota bacterium]